MFSLKGQFIVKIAVGRLALAIPLVIYSCDVLRFVLMVRKLARLQKNGDHRFHGFRHTSSCDLRCGGGVRIAFGAGIAAFIGPLVEVPAFALLVNVACG